MRMGFCGTSVWRDRIQLSFICTSIKRAFALSCLTCRDDANNRTMIPLAMTDDEQLCTRTHTEICDGFRLIPFELNHNR
jgi:hypothetical protein